MLARLGLTDAAAKAAEAEQQMMLRRRSSTTSMTGGNPPVHFVHILSWVGLGRPTLGWKFTEAEWCDTASAEMSVENAGLCFWHSVSDSSQRTFLFKFSFSKLGCTQRLDSVCTYVS